MQELPEELLSFYPKLSKTLGQGSKGLAWSSAGSAPDFSHHSSEQLLFLTRAGGAEAHIDLCIHMEMGSATKSRSDPHAADTDPLAPRRVLPWDGLFPLASLASPP